MIDKKIIAEKLVMYARASFSLIYFIGMAFYLYFSGRCEKTLHIPTKDDIFSGWKNYFEIALPSMLIFLDKKNQ